MKILNKLKVTRFAQLNAGELFYLCHDIGIKLALVVSDPIDGDKLAVLLNPPFSPNDIGPTLLAPSGTVMSFTTEFLLRLPCNATGWQEKAPPPEVTCFAVAEENVYLRANYSPQGQPFRPCYIDMATGIIRADGARNGYIPPRGIYAFAIQWELLTDEEKPRLILASP